MPKNKGKGGKNRRRGKNDSDRAKRELVFKSEGQVYGQVMQMLGNGRLRAHCSDGQIRLANIRGKLRKKVWINQGDVILLSLRDYQDAKADVLLKYTPDEAKVLKAKKEILDTVKLNDLDVGHEDHDIIEFGSESENDESSASESREESSEADSDDLDDI